MDTWRSGGNDAEQGWIDAGHPAPTAQSRVRRKASAVATNMSKACWCDTRRMAKGSVTEVSGYGPLRKVKIRFSSAGERTFLVEKAKLAVVRRE